MTSYPDGNGLETSSFGFEEGKSNSRRSAGRCFRAGLNVCSDNDGKVKLHSGRGGHPLA